MLRRHLARLGVTRLPGASQPRGEAAVDSAAQSNDGGEAHSALLLRAALPRLADDALQRDLTEVLRMLERDLRRSGRAGSG